jgi:hypothetical protein
VVPGRHIQAVIALAKLFQAQIGRPKIEVAAVARQQFGGLGLELVVGLRHHHHRHAEEQGQQQAPRALAHEAPSAPTRHQALAGCAGHQKEQAQTPGPAQQHQGFDQMAGVRTLHMPIPAHVIHADVVGNQQQESGHAQAVEEGQAVACDRAGVHVASLPGARRRHERAGASGGLSGAGGDLPARRDSRATRPVARRCSASAAPRPPAAAPRPAHAPG